MGVVELCCPVRETASRVIMIENPLDTPVEILAS
jgi:hypothetical protein